MGILVQRIWGQLCPPNGTRSIPAIFSAPKYCYPKYKLCFKTRTASLQIPASGSLKDAGATALGREKVSLINWNGSQRLRKAKSRT